MIVLAGRGLSSFQGDEAQLLSQRQTMLAFVVFIVPLMVCSLPASALADRVSKRSIILGAKLLELLLMLIGTAVLAWGAEPLLGAYFVLGFMGLQSAFFGPAKYGILPELVPHERLSAANGALESSTFMAIIAGTALGAPLMSGVGQPWLAGAVLSGLSLMGLLFARGIPRVPAARPQAVSVRETVAGAWGSMRADRQLWLAVVGATWFWAVASALGQNMMVYARTVLLLPESAIGVPFLLFGIGVAGGSLLAGRFSESKVEAGLIPLGALGLGLFILLLGALAPGLVLTLVLMALIGVSSGFLIVPLDALIQWRSPAHQRGAIIALMNVFVSGGMLLGSLGGWQLAEQDFSSRGIMLGASLVTLVGTAWALRLMPEALVRLVAFVFTHLVYRVRVEGLEHVPRRGGVLLTPNHVSFVDGFFLMATLDRRVRFIIAQSQYDRPFVKPIMKVLGAIPIASDGGTRAVLGALRKAGDALDEGRVVCIFPEGAITRTGALQPFRRGMERIAKGRQVPVVPVHLDRLWGSIFSFSGGRFVKKLPKQLPYPVSVTYGEPLHSDTPLTAVRDAVATLGERAWFARKDDRAPLHRPFLSLARRKPWAFCLGDASDTRTSRLKAAAGAVALARALRGAWAGQSHVGILLPSTVGGALANVAASVSGRTSVNLNFTTGPAGLQSAAKQAQLRTVLTSRVFLEKAQVALPEGLEPLWIEDVVAALGVGSRLAAAFAVLALPARVLERACGAAKPVEMDDVATVLFSSGSTGEPKGVMLTHFNVDSNVDAVAQVFRLEAQDRLLGILPLFHSFGFMSLWFAVNNGVPVVFHPNPLDAAAVGGLVHRDRLTLLLATPTFLQMYVRRCRPHEFGSLRLVLTGAEKLNDSLATAFEERFGIRPLEGYGATECSPVIATSIPSFRAPGFFQPGSRRGAVGPPLPGVALRIVDPETREPVGVGQPGLLLVRGPNVMKGYLGREDLTAKALRDGWYETGDLALQEADGFLRITDRLSRFSKIGGEMVPHGRVEEALHEAAQGDGRLFAVTALPDERKGERLAVLTTLDQQHLPAVLERLSSMGLPNLFIPRLDSFVKVDEIPILGTGKTDLARVKACAAESLA